MDKLPRGLSRKPNGIRVRIYREGRKAYDQTLLGNPHSANLVREAHNLAKHVRECMSLGIPLEGPSKSTLFSDAAASWRNQWQGDPDVLKGYRAIVNRVWMPVFHNLAVSQISQSQIEEVLSSLNIKIKAKKNYLSPLKMILDHARVTPNPASGIKFNRKMAKAEKVEIHRYTPQQQADIIAALDWIHEEAVELCRKHPMKRFKKHWTEQARVFYPLLFATGLRPGEALALRWEDYDGTRLYIHATHSQGKRKEATKTGDTRWVYVPERVRPRIDELTTKFKGGAMFVGNHRGPLLKKQNLNAIWREALTVCGLPDQDPYTCRHSRAAELLSMGKASLAECAYQLGHTVTVFQSVYSEFIEDFAPQSDYSQFESEIAPTSPQWTPSKVIKLDKTGG